jgi:glutathione synthase/RimK-type ligase-like ATP-grasp enzyme
MEAEGWSVTVAKPVSSQSGHGVLKIDRSNIDHWPTGEMLLQEYQDDIGALGETTMTFIEGTFSHAVRRVLKPGEWRANAQFGITYERVDVSRYVIETAQAYVDFLPQTPLYARVDGLVRPSGFTLMELELIDPYLYLEFAPGSADVIARAVLQRLG